MTLPSPGEEERLARERQRAHKQSEARLSKADRRIAESRRLVERLARAARLYDERLHGRVSG